MNSTGIFKFSREELELLDQLLSLELETVKIEIHHSRNHEYKDYLKEREKEVISLLERVKSTLAVTV